MSTITKYTNIIPYGYVSLDGFSVMPYDEYMARLVSDSHYVKHSVKWYDNKHDRGVITEVYDYGN